MIKVSAKMVHDQTLLCITGPHTEGMTFATHFFISQLLMYEHISELAITGTSI
jgi:hypothetical protein